MTSERDLDLYLVIDDDAEKPGAHLYHPDFGYIVYAGVPAFAVEDMVIDDDEEVEYRSRFGFTYSNDDMRRILATHENLSECPGDCEYLEMFEKRRDLITDYILMYPQVPKDEKGTDCIHEPIEDSFLEQLEDKLGEDSIFAKLIQKLAGFPVEGFRYVDNVDRSVDGIDTTDGAIAYPIRVRVFADD